tara:strand:+ start:21421 stop:23544 length:2124 start_codon:yes stop_codon:yes gene_type:complete
MKQIIQNLKNGVTSLIDTPIPECSKNNLLIKSEVSLVSLGTEKMLKDFGKSSYLSKAKNQPDKVRQVLSKLKTDGFFETFNAVNNKLNQPINLGYSNVGKVIKIGSNVNGYKIGDRVVSNGHHAEYVSVNKNLVAKIPKNVTDEEASFTVVGSIALHGLRLIKPTFNETIVVIGLGLIGQLTCQLLKANGCNVIAFDYDQSKVNLAKSNGVKAINITSKINTVQYVMDKTNHIGSDGIIITASNKSNQIIKNCAEMCRKRGRIILVGVIGLNLNRDDFYKKEITFQVSCSYGPGRYDNNYEVKSMDYPIAYVRWTENRNFLSILNAISNKVIDVNKLITNKFELKDYEKIYSNINPKGNIANLITYNKSKDNSHRSILNIIDKSFDIKKPIFGIIGSGNFTNSVILPKIKKNNFQVKSIASSQGLNSTLMAKKFSINYSTTDYKKILNDNDISSLIITTNHGSHAKFVLEGLKKNKFIFVEKPLATKNKDLDKIIEFSNKSKGWVTVGFNRRFSPLSTLLKNKLSDSYLNINYTINSGYIPYDSWVHDEKEGGRIVGEICHFIDFCSFITGSTVKTLCASFLGNDVMKNSDNVSILVKYTNGSIASINYFSNGSKMYSKERIEVYQHDKTYIIDNWNKFIEFGVGLFGSKTKKISQNKGHENQFIKLIDHIENAKGPTISLESLINTSRATLAISDSLFNERWINVR